MKRGQSRGAEELAVEADALHLVVGTGSIIVTSMRGEADRFSRASWTR